MGTFKAIFLSLAVITLTQWSFALAEAPFARTNPPTLLAQNLARLNGFADPKGDTSQMTRWFEWGATILLGNSTGPTISYGGVASSFSDSIFLTDINQTYYFRAVAQNSEGISYGQILSFKPQKPAIKNIIEQLNGKSEPSPAELSGANKSLPLQDIIVENSVFNLSFENGVTQVVSAKAGDTLRFTIKIKNTGKKTLGNLTLKNTLSPFLEFIEASDKENFEIAKNEISWKIEKIKPQEEKALSAKVKAKKFSGNIVIENSAVLSDGTNFVNSNAVSILLNASPISLAVKSGTEKIYPGEIIDYGVFYKNESETELKNVSLKIILPKNLEFEKGDGKFALGDLKSKKEGFVNFKVKANKEIKNDEKFSVAAAIGYEDMFFNKQDDVVAYADGVFGEKPAGTAAGVFAEEGFFTPSLLNFSMLASLLLVSGALIWHFHRLYFEKNQETEMLRQKITAINRMAIKQKEAPAGSLQKFN